MSDSGQPAARPDGNGPPELGAADLLLGFHEAHRRVGASAARLQEASANVIALAELLIGKGVIGLEELDRQRHAVEARLDAAYARDRLQIELAQQPRDKYALNGDSVTIDCEARLPLCRAACCRLRFALTEQDIHEGAVQWDLEQPYLNRQGEDGWCAHCHPSTKRCHVYQQRPGVCRTYDCRGDKRIWLDFEGRVVNPELFADGGPARRSLPIVGVS